MTLEVTAVKGRYPSRPAVFRPETIEVTVTEVEPGRYVLRADDADDPVFWLEIHLQRGET